MFAADILLLEDADGGPRAAVAVTCSRSFVRPNSSSVDRKNEQMTEKYR